MSDVLDRLKTALADQYTVERELGRGGMATVYLAHDIKHDRKVAVKVLHPELAAVLGAERFLNEIRVTANLQHPHILPLFDSGDAEGLLFYVMPYIEGESLRDKLGREKQLQVAEAIRIAREAASALDYAHRHNVIHRDIKPGNVLLQDGQALVADFGIALAVTAAGGDRITETGLSLGTPEYMSPEQATGDRPLDARSDIYSLGAVVYEMLTGEPPLTAPTVQALLFRVVAEQPRRARELRETIPVYVEAVLEKVLAKLPADRFEDAGQFAEALANPSLAVPVPSPVAPRRRPSIAVPVWLTWVLGASFAVVTGAAAWGWFRARPPEPLSALRFEVNLRESERTIIEALGPAVAFSPDGSRVVYVGRGERGGQLYVRTLDRVGFSAILGTERGENPFFSPDGQWVGFLRDGKLHRVSVWGGPAVSFADAAYLHGASWGPDDIIVFSPASDSGLWRVVGDQEAEPLTEPKAEEGETGHWWPEILPDGKNVLFTVWGESRSEARIAVVSLETRAIRHLPIEGSDARYVRPGHLVYSRADGSALRVPFHLASLEVTGPAVPVRETWRIGSLGIADFSVSRNGSLVYVPRPAGRTMVLVNRQGAESRLAEELRLYNQPRFSPDGKHVAVAIREEGSQAADIWLYQMDRGPLSRLTIGGFAHPLWEPEGRGLAVSSFEPTERGDLHWVLADGSGAVEPLLSRSNDVWAFSWSPDGQNILLTEDDPATGSDIWVLPLTGDREPWPYLRSQFQEASPQFSPDGRYVAYESDESGRYEVYVRAFPSSGARWQVSTDGGAAPRWAPSGRELLYRTRTHVVSARVQTEFEFTVQNSSVLFEDKYERGAYAWDIHPDGDRFVMLREPEAATRLMVVLNWADQLESETTSGVPYER